MLPIVLDPQSLNVIVVGDGPATKNRLKMLEVAGVEKFDYIKEFDFARDYSQYNLAYVADFSDEVSKEIYDHLKSFNLFVNVEDKKKFCDFHVPSIVKRGKLMFTISTGGNSPRVSRRVRKMLEFMFPENWSEKIDNIGKKREKWKSLGDSYVELSAKTDELIEEDNYFENICKNCIRVSKD